MLAPDLGASLRLTGSMSPFNPNAPLKLNHNQVMLGMVQETESGEDHEAQRNRNIDLADLQSLFA